MCSDVEAKVDSECRSDTQRVTQAAGGRPYTREDTEQGEQSPEQNRNANDDVLDSAACEKQRTLCDIACDVTFCFQLRPPLDRTCAISVYGSVHHSQPVT